MPNLNGLLPVLIPLGILEVVLTVAALIHIFTHKKCKFGNVCYGSY